MRVVALALVALSALTIPDAAFARQRRPAPPDRVVSRRLPTQQQVDDTIRNENQLHEAAEAYLAGDREAAFRAFDRLPFTIQTGTAQGMRLALEAKREFQRSGRKPLPSPVEPTVKALEWDTRLLRGLAALEMEALLRAYQQRGRAAGEYPRNYALAGEALFGFIEGEPGERYAGSRWELALGLTMIGDGELAWARAVLQAPCKEPESDPEILLACGTLHEVWAMQPADAITGDLTEPAPRTRIWAQPLTMPRETYAYGLPESLVGPPTPVPSSVQRSHLDRSGDAFEQVLRLQPDNAEARLRLAHVRVLEKKDAAAVPLLERIVSRTAGADAAHEYLARLFLAGIEQRRGRLGAAAALLEGAVALVPTGQSALVALAAVQRARDEVDGMARVTDRMLKAGASPPDPWWTYPAGQYWLADPLLAEVRADARR